MTIRYCDACSEPATKAGMNLWETGPTKFDLCDKCHSKLLNILGSQAWQIPKHVAK